MSPPLHAMNLLLRLSDGEVERRGAELTAKQALIARSQRTLARLDALCGEQSATVSPVLAHGRAVYKQNLMAMMAAQRQDLALVEADAAVSQQRLGQARLARERIAHGQMTLAGALARQAARREQRDCDELASQAWQRGKEGV